MYSKRKPSCIIGAGDVDQAKAGAGEYIKYALKFDMVYPFVKMFRLNSDLFTA